MKIIQLIIELIVIGFASWLVTTAPFIDDSFKQIIKWILIAVAAFLVVYFLIGYTGVSF